MTAFSLSENQKRIAGDRIRRYTVLSKSGCLIWQRAKNNKGYGMTRIPNTRRNVLAHRLAFYLANGPFPNTDCILHRCDTPLCCNALHLFVGSRKDNAEDMCAKRRQALGVKNGMAKLTRADIMDIRGDTIETCRALADRYGVSVSTISDIQIGRYWASCPGQVRKRRKRGEDRREAKLTESDVRGILSDRRTQQAIRGD